MVAEALGVVLRRDFRSGLYEYLTAGLHDAVDPSTYPLLSGLDRQGPASAAALGPQIGLDRSVVSRRAARLSAAGLLKSSADPADARASLLSLTPTGQKIVLSMRARLITAIEHHLIDWPAEDRLVFGRLITRFAEEGSLLPPPPPN